MEGPPLRVLYKRISHFNGQYCKIYWNGLVLSGNINLIPYGKRLIIKTPERYIVVYFGISGTVKRKNINGEKPSMVIVSERSVSLFFYRCAISEKTLDEFLEYYDPRKDVMDPQWDPSGAITKIKALRKTDSIISFLQS